MEQPKFFIIIIIFHYYLIVFFFYLPFLFYCFYFVNLFQ